MPISRSFVWAYSENYGIAGWRPANMPDFDPTLEGFGMMHDVLEHFSPTDSSIEAEFMAFGSMLYLRAEPDYWCAIGAYHVAPEEQMAPDIFEFIRYGTVEQGDSIPCPGVTRDLDTEVEDIMWRIKLKLQKNFVEDGWDERCDAELIKAFGWMRRGYRKAARRWNLTNNERLRLFINGTDYCNQFLKRVQFHEEGDKLTIRVDKKRLTFSHNIKRAYGRGDW